MIAQVMISRQGDGHQPTGPTGPPVASLGTATPGAEIPVRTGGTMTDGRRFDAVLFDMDGVLVDSEHHWNDVPALPGAPAPHGVPGRHRRLAADPAALTERTAAALRAMTADYPDPPPSGRLFRRLTELFNDWPEGARPELGSGDGAERAAG
jgi:hypothetical protein